MIEYQIGVRSDFNRTGYGVFYHIDKNRILWVGDVYETWEEAYKEMISLYRHNNHMVSKNYLDCLEQQIQEEHKKWVKADERMQHYANQGKVDLMNHFECERSNLEGSIRALNLAIHLFKMGMGEAI